MTTTSEIPAQLITLNNLADAVLYFAKSYRSIDSDTGVLIDAILERTDKPLDIGVWYVMDQPRLPVDNPRLHRWVVGLMLMPEFSGTTLYPDIQRWIQRDPELSTQIFRDNAALHGTFYTHQISYAIISPRDAFSVATHILGSYWFRRELQPHVVEGVHADDYATRLLQLLCMIAPWLPEQVPNKLS